ncbi:MAG: SRPBCC family protein, partial [Actinomycetota bacterium]|nr:SRPBCC family protein [Actinomycetota bacterium]
GMTQHREVYEDIGELTVWVEDLEERWKYEQERRRVYVVPGKAAFELGKVVPAPPPVAWEYVTSPRKRPLWQGIDRVDFVSGGRRGAGTVQHCVHGSQTVLEEFLDWRPFRYYTVRYQIPLVGPWVWTVEFEPAEDGTRVELRGDELHGKRRLAWALIRPFMVKQLRADQERLAEVLAERTSDAEAAAGSVA